jgi:hypothetical protein
MVNDKRFFCLIVITKKWEDSRMQRQVERNQSDSDQIVAIRSAKCINGGSHNIKVIKYIDSSVWVCCPHFGWYEDHHSLELGCKDRKKRCIWHFSHY